MARKSARQLEREFEEFQRRAATRQANIQWMESKLAQQAGDKWPDIQAKLKSMAVATEYSYYHLLDMVYSLYGDRSITMLDKNYDKLLRSLSD